MRSLLAELLHHQLTSLKPYPTCPASAGYQDALSTFEGYGIKIEGEDDAETAAAIAKQVQQGEDSSSSSSQQPPPKPPEETPAADAKVRSAVDCHTSSTNRGSRAGHAMAVC